MSARSILLTHKRLESLDLSCTDIDAAGLSEIFAKPWPKLQQLVLVGNSLQADAIAALLSVSLPMLNALTFSQNRLDVNAALLLSVGKWPKLRYLTLNHNNPDTAAMAFLAKGKWPALLWLDLHDNHIGILGLELLMAGQWRQLRSLTLDFGSVTEADWRLLNLAPSTMPSSMNKFGYLVVSRQLTVHDCIWPNLKAVEFKHTQECAAAARVYQEQDNKVVVNSVGTNTELLTRLGGSTSARVSGKSNPTGIEVVGWCTVACLSIWFVKEVCRYTRSKRLLTTAVNFFLSETTSVYAVWRDTLCVAPRCKDMLTE